jgi:hypothetical protein
VFDCGYVYTAVVPLRAPGLGFVCSKWNLYMLLSTVSTMPKYLDCLDIFYILRVHSF